MLKRPALLFLLIALLAVSAACGGKEAPTATPTSVPPATILIPTDTPVPTDTPEPTAAPTDTPEPTPISNVVRTLQDVEKAVIQIVAEGTFVDPEAGLQLNAAGSGSGFIIDESGVAVTNNHVVTGAALLQVYVAGSSRPVNAKVLGVSECSDLAVIDLDGDGYAFVDWFDNDIKVGMDVYTAGFPLGDPEFTLTRGIISKAEADGETSWASVDYVLEHDATINPGNSGGPLVTAEGQVVGINYAGAFDTSQYFAISRDEAVKVLNTLRTGTDVTSIGINGTAINDGVGLSGIWVSSVQSGSPADKAGVEAGDIITSLEGLVLALDGTMSTYCDILRSHDATDTLAIEVLRYSTQEVWQGQLNGEPLALAFSFADTLGDQVTDTGADTGTIGGGYTDYVTVTDDSGKLILEVPTEWSDTNGSAWSRDGEDVGYGLSASTDLDAYYNTWMTPGVFFGASTTLVATYTPEQALDDIDFSDSCTYGGRETYADAYYTGFYDTWQDCGGEGTLFISLASVPEDAAFLIVVQVQIVSDADLEAFDHILNSFFVSTE